MYKRKKTKSAKTKSMGKIKHIKTEIDGIVFDSKMESEYYLYLKELKSKGIVKNIELQPEYLLQDKFIVVDGIAIEGSDPNFSKIKRKNKATTIQAIKYIADFKVEYSDGHIEIIDTKGQETADFKIKKKMFIRKFPDLDFKLLILDYKTKTWILYEEYQKLKKNK